MSQHGINNILSIQEVVCSINVQLYHIIHIKHLINSEQKAYKFKK